MLENLTKIFVTYVIKIYSTLSNHMDITYLYKFLENAPSAPPKLVEQCNIKNEKISNH